MKKVVLVIIVLLLSIINITAVNAASSNTDITVIVLKIEKASYSDLDKVFYVYTVPDEDGGFWVMDFTPKKNETLAQFKKRSIGR